MGTAGWVVVVEATNRVEHWRLQRLLEHLQGLTPVGLHTAERVVVQLNVGGPDEVGALGVALTRLRETLPKVGLPDLQIVRAEVLTREEFDMDCRLVYADESAEHCPHCGRAVTRGQTPGLAPAPR